MDSTPTLFAPTTTGRLAPAIVPIDPNVRKADRKRLSAQCLTVLRIMQQTGKINPRIAAKYGIQRLAGRVHDLKGHGYSIVGKRENGESEMTYRLGETR